MTIARKGDATAVEGAKQQKQMLIDIIEKNDHRLFSATIVALKKKTSQRNKEKYRMKVK